MGICSACSAIFRKTRNADNRIRTCTPLAHDPKSCVSAIPPYQLNADNGSRTRMVFLPRDFKSLASANSAISA